MLAYLLNVEHVNPGLKDENGKTAIMIAREQRNEATEGGRPREALHYDLMVRTLEKYAAGGGGAPKRRVTA